MNSVRINEGSSQWKASFRNWLKEKAYFIKIKLDGVFLWWPSKDFYSLEGKFSSWTVFSNAPLNYKIFWSLKNYFNGKIIVRLKKAPGAILCWERWKFQRVWNYKVCRIHCNKTVNKVNKKPHLLIIHKSND